MPEISSRWPLLGMLLLFGVLTVKDMIPQSSAEVEKPKEIPMTKFNQFVGPTLKFLYCYS